MNKISISMGSRFVRSLGLALAFVLTGSVSLVAQNAVRISEVQPVNANGFTDEFGHRAPWIEFNNATAATTNMAGMYLTDDLSDPTKYPIRSGSQKTVIAPHQTLVLFLDGSADRGVYHSGLKLDPTKETTIYLFEGDGVNLVDQVTVPVLSEGQSYARLDFVGRDKKGDFTIQELPTPDEPNTYVHGNQNVENFKTQDPIGLVMTLIAMGVVFSGLVLLFFVFGSMGKFFNKRDAKVDKSVKKETPKQTKVMTATKTNKTPSSASATPEGVQAAIAMALHDYQNSGLQAAIALAIYETERGRNEQTGMIHLRRDPATSAWANKAFTMRRNPGF